MEQKRYMIRRGSLGVSSHIVDVMGDHGLGVNGPVMKVDEIAKIMNEIDREVNPIRREYVSQKEAAHILGRTDITPYKSDPTFPRPYTTSKKAKYAAYAIFYRKQDIIDWMESKKEKAA